MLWENYRKNGYFLRKVANFTIAFPRHWVLVPSVHDSTKFVLSLLSLSPLPEMSIHCAVVFLSLLGTKVFSARPSKHFCK